MARKLSDIAQDIVADWEKPHFSALPYIKAMANLRGMGDRKGADDAESIVLYFLTNAGSWRGPTSRAIKKELRKMVDSRPKRASSEWVANAYLMKLRSQR